MEQVGCIAPHDLSNGACKRTMKDTLALMFSKSYQFVRFQADKIEQLKAELSHLIENLQ